MTDLDLIRALVAADSSNPPGDETAVATVIEGAAAVLGLPAPARLARLPHRPNLVLEIGRGEPALLLGGHMDTVPAGDPSAWGGDPLELRTDGSRLVGLGVADMKSALAVMLRVAAGVRAEVERRGRLVLAFVADEEHDADCGMSWLARTGALRADAAVLLEPASCTRGSWDGLYIAERGSCVVRLAASGVPGHSGEPVAAADRAGRPFIEALHALAAADLFAEHRHPVDGTRPRVNLPTVVSGGASPWAHPPVLEALMEVRSVPGMTADGVHAEVGSVLAAAGLRDRVTATVVSWGDPGGAVSDPRLLDVAAAACETTLGRVPPRAVFPASTDRPFVERAGIPTLPAFGPGTLAAVHQPGEWLEAGDVGLAAELVSELVLRFLRR